MNNDVVVGWVHPGDVKSAFMDSLLRSVGYDLAEGGGRFAGWMGMQCSANVSAGRNGLVDWFLDSTQADWLMQIDTDMVWEPDAVHRLLKVADAEHAPIVGGLCFGLEADTGLIFPTLYDLGGTVERVEFLRLRQFPMADLLRVSGTGAAFLLVHRRVFEAFRERGFNKAYPFFQEQDLQGMRCGEDVTFCLRAGELGFPVHVSTNVHIGHIKSTVVTAKAYAVQLAFQEQEELQNG